MVLVNQPLITTTGESTGGYTRTAPEEMQGKERNSFRTKGCSSNCEEGCKQKDGRGEQTQAVSEEILGRNQTRETLSNDAGAVYVEASKYDDDVVGEHEAADASGEPGRIPGRRDRPDGGRQ